MQILYSAFVIPFGVAIVIQGLKLGIDFFNGKKIQNMRQLFVSGGFPSVHSGISASIVTVVGLVDGVASTAFAITLVFGFLFVYDAMNLRYEAGKHAHYLNSLRIELKNVLHQDKPTTGLKERLGHTPIEVIWGIFAGVGLSFLFANRMGLW